MKAYQMKIEAENVSEDCADDEYRATPAGPHSFLTIADRIPTMSESELKEVFENPETVFGYLISEREPAFDLRGLFESFSRKKLQALASQMNLPGRSGLRKSELIEAVYDFHMNSSSLRFLMNQMDEDRITVLHDIMRTEIYYVTDEDFPYEFALDLLANHVITAFYDGDRIAVVALRESKEIYRKTLREMQEILDDILDELDDFACAAANLYGVISTEDFMSVYFDQSGSDFDEATVLRFLCEMIGDEEDSDVEYRIRGDFLISDALDDWSDDEIAELHGKARAHPLRVPPKERFLAYADRFYFEETPAHVKFLEFARGKLKPDADGKTQERLLAGEVCELLRQWAPPEECFDVLESFGIELRDPKEIKHVAKLLSQVADDTKLWGRNGVTPNESLSDKSAGGRTFKNPERKIGRNEPCPCGSGKKHKNCCGKPLN